MDWHSWLSKSSGLNPILVYEYSLLLSRNELEEDDIPCFDHEFLQSMGIPVAKHRLEILKLAGRKDRRHHPVLPVAVLITAIRKAHKCFKKYVNGLVNHDIKSMVVVPKSSYGGERGMGNNWMRMSRRLMVGAKQGRLALTHRMCSGVKASQPGQSPLSRCTSPLVLGNRKGSSWVGSTEAGGIRWDSMFKDLNPT